MVSVSQRDLNLTFCCKRYCHLLFVYTKFFAYAYASITAIVLDSANSTNNINVSLWYHIA